MCAILLLAQNASQNGRKTIFIRTVSIEHFAWIENKTWRANAVRSIKTFYYDYLSKLSPFFVSIASFSLWVENHIRCTYFIQLSQWNHYIRPASHIILPFRWHRFFLFFIHWIATTFFVFSVCMCVQCFDVIIDNHKIVWFICYM